MENKILQDQQYVASLIKRARKAQEAITHYTQEETDTLVKAVAWEIVKAENSKKIAEFAVEESQLGNYQGKYVKLQKKIRGNLRDMQGAKTVGIIEDNEKTGIIKIAKPVGVIGALVPCTNPEATPVIKAMNALKGKNAIIFAPHPRTKKTNTMIIEKMRGVLKRYNAPEDLLIAIDEPSMGISDQLMKQCDLVVATGGSGMVKAAYSSGTPAYGVGAGNSIVVVDETADLNDAANKIMLSKTFDYATSCSSENSIVVIESVYDDLMKNLQSEGGCLLNTEEKEKLQKALWIDNHLNRDVIAQPVEKIAKIADLVIDEDKSFLMVEETGVGAEFPYSGEKMSVVLTVYKVANFDSAIDKVNELTKYQGAGHSCGLHTTDDERVKAIGLRTKTSRIMIRQAQCYGNSGNWNNGMPFTMTLGCGTWGGNISSENISYKQFINVTWVSKPIPEVIPTDEELFGDIMNN